MSIFGSIMHKIFHHDQAAQQASTDASTDGSEAAPASATASSAQASGAQASGAQASAASPSASVAPVDVGAVLTQMASQKGGGGNYQTSIVDLLKLLDLDSSLDARKDLAGELSVHAGADGSAEQNIALHHAVMQKLAENGGKVPDSMKG